ncbi:hypothetical protein [Frankia sp. Cppng1_Ct_nod]|uniref:hypothetical protein n=1 Tax=Frankia sp. Cppng1_Ct_nod TaxID=2897162 RepID=UPI001040F2A6|nr:hypothetical protein [Frankia sp. Cppng1_Ct_nod]
MRYPCRYRQSRARRHTKPARRTDPVPDEGQLPLRRNRQGVPDRAQGQLLRRERRPRRPDDSNPAVGAFLVTGNNTAAPRLASWLRDVAGPDAVVTDITGTRQTVGSSLTAVDLAGISRVELGFALLLVAASGALLSSVLVTVLTAVFDPPPQTTT